MKRLLIVMIFSLLFFSSCGDEIDLGAPAPTTKTPEKSTVIVDIKGEVRWPGIYEVEKGSTLYQVIDTAGGLTKYADTSQIFLAERVIEDSMYKIPSFNEMNETDKPHLVNINTASVEELVTVKYIGPSLAEKIIAYRNANGRFRHLEDIINVSGISENIFEKIKDYICI